MRITLPMTRRITLEIPDAAFDSMEQARNLLGIRTKTELIKRSLALMHTLAEAESKGGKIIVETRNGKKERLRLV